MTYPITLTPEQQAKLVPLLSHARQQRPPASVVGELRREVGGAPVILFTVVPSKIVEAMRVAGKAAMKV